MNRHTHHRQHGFVLITGLIFLVIITLLALSSMNTTTLQEKLASNLREQSRATEASEAVLRQGEALVGDFDEYRPSGQQYTFDPTPGDESNGDEIDWHLWQEGELVPSGHPRDFLERALWVDDPQDDTDPVPHAVDKNDFDAGLSGDPQYFVEEMQNFEPRNLSPETRAKAQGRFLYRVTGRAEGGKPSAVAVTQSLYMKRY